MPSDIENCSIPYSCDRYIPSRITQDIADLSNPFISINELVPAINESKKYQKYVYKRPDIKNTIDTTLILLVIVLLFLASLIK